MPRREFGNIAKLKSGRYPATWKVDGVRHTAPTTYRLKGDAQAFLRTTHDQIEKGTYQAPRKKVRRSVEEVGKSWLGSNVNKAPSTLSRDRSILTQHVYPYMGDRDITEIARDDIQTMVNQWATRMVTDDDGNVISTGVAASSVKRQYTCMASMFNYADLNDWIPASPCKRINLPGEAATDRHLLSGEEVAQILRSVDRKLFASVCIGAELGIRWNEIYGLHVGDVDLDENYLTITRGLTRKSSGASKVSTGSVKAKPRPMAISETLTGILARHIERLEDKDTDAWLFPDANGGPQRYTNWRTRIWLPALKAAGLDEIAPTPGIHDLRRLAATRLAADKVDSRVMMHRMGHKSAKLGLEVYAQADPAADRAQAERMADYVFGSMSRIGRADASHGEEVPD